MGKVDRHLRRASRWQWLLGLFWAVTCLPVAWSADLAEIEVSGVDRDIRDNIMAYIGDIPSDSLKTWQSLQLRLNESIGQAMQSLGYYSAIFKVTKTGGKVVVTVIPGDPVKIRNISIELLGEAETDPDWLKWKSAISLKEGDIFNHGRYEHLKTELQALATENGYFDAEWKQHEVKVNPELKTADITLVYESGTRYRFGNISFLLKNGNQQNLLKPRLLDAFVPFSSGDVYEAEKVIELNRSLLNSRYFSDIRVQVQRDRAENTQIPIDVVMAADKPNHLDFGLGYSTDIEGRISAKWQRPLINESGHGIEANMELSPVRSSFDAKYVIPLTHPINDNLQLFYGVKREDAQSVINWNTVLGAQRQIKKKGGWQYGYSLRWNRDTTEIPHQSTVKADLLLPGVSLDRTRSKGGMDPYWGDRQYYQVEVGSENLLSDTDIVLLRTGFRFLRTFVTKHQFIVRTDAGVLFTNNFNNVPQSMRFFAGGDQSVRGYGYKSISPRDTNGIIIGASHLLTGGVEYDYEFVPRWRLALFTDAGDAFDNIGDESFKVGSGAGIRWVSPVGPIRLDFAWAVNQPDKPFRIHFSMGPTL